MSVSPLEHDLLDLIEGRLAPDRAESVRAALTRDPALLRRIERLVADRKGIIELGRVGVRATASDRDSALEQVREAIQRAEREALFVPPARAHRRRVSPIAAAVVVMLTVGLIAGGMTWFGVRRTEWYRMAEVEKAKRTSTGMITVAPPTDPADAAAGTLIGPPQSVPIATLPSWINTGVDTMSAEAVRSWTGDLERRLTSETAAESDPAPAGEAALGRIRSGGDARLTLDEAVGLALSHPLRLVVRGGPAEGSFDALADRSTPVTGAAAGSESTPLRADAERGDRLVEVRAALDDHRLALRDALGNLQRRFAPMHTDHAWFELDPSSESAGGVVMPSLRLNDILWWSNAPTAWQPGVSIRVRIHYVGSNPPTR